MQLKRSINAVPNKVGWTPLEWSYESGIGRSVMYGLIQKGRIKTVKSGKATIIITPPAEYLASLADSEAA
jgi:hypothetical protein